MPESELYGLLALLVAEHPKATREELWELYLAEAKASPELIREAISYFVAEECRKMRH